MDALIIGISALTLGLLYRVPQVYKIYKTKSAEDVSEKTLHIQNASYFLYIAYGVLLKDPIYISSSIIGILQNITILILKKIYRPISQQENNNNV